MRIAVVSPFVDRRHGTERALAELLERLARDGRCEIHLYAQRVEDLALDRPAAPRGKGSGAIVWHKVPSIPGPHLLQFLSWLLLNSFCRRWDRWVHGVRYDLVLSPGINCLEADVVIVHALFRRLQELAGGDGGKAPASGTIRHIHRRAYYAFLTGLERRLYSSRRIRLAAVSQRTAALLQKFFQRPDVRVIPNGVDTSQFSPDSRLTRREDARRRRDYRDEDFVLLLIGNDWRNKGLLTIFEAMAASPDQSLQLLVVGGEAPGSFLKAARRLGVLDRCRFLSPVANVLDFYAAADLYVSPSLEDSFGLPVAEAMACGLPVITSINAGVAELMCDGVNGYILRDAHDFRALARLINELRDDAELRRRIGEASATTAREWTWDRNADAVWELLQEALRQKRKTRVPKDEE